MRILIVSGSRADRGLLEPVKAELEKEHDIRWVDVSTEDVMSSSNAYDIVQLHLCEMYDNVFEELSYALSESKPELMIVLGDRYEILYSCLIATLYGVPIAHLCGGDVTEGSYDNYFRNAITQLSSIHFASNEESAERIRKMGRDNVYCVGSPGLDGITDDLLYRDEMPFEFGEKNILVCHYPATLGKVEEFDEVLAAVDEIDAEKFFILPNSDVGSDYARKKLKGRDNVFDSLPRQMFLSLLKECDVVVGNTSAGLYEAPSLGTATVNVGVRQQGRLAGASVIHCPAEKVAIVDAINSTLSIVKPKHIVALMGNCDLYGKLKEDFVFKNPYAADGNASKRIAQILRGWGK